MNSEMNTSMQSRRLTSGEHGKHGTPESELSNFECYQNYTAPEVFVQGLAGIVNQGDVELIVRAQKQMLQRFEKTNEMLLNCNALSGSRLKMANDDFKKHIKLINDMKKDLDYIFKKVRNIKGRISAQYPQAVERLEKKTKTASPLAEEDAVAIGETEQQIDKERKSSKHETTVNYVQIDGNENGTSAQEAKSTEEFTDNESSDCTTDT